MLFRRLLSNTFLFNRCIEEPFSSYKMHNPLKFFKKDIKLFQ